MEYVEHFTIVYIICDVALSGLQYIWYQQGETC